MNHPAADFGDSRSLPPITDAAGGALRALRQANFGSGVDTVWHDLAGRRGRTEAALRVAPVRE